MVATTSRPTVIAHIRRCMDLAERNHIVLEEVLSDADVPNWVDDVETTINFVSISENNFL